jgi:glutaredoxin
MKKIILLTTKTCPYCPVAKALWQSLKKDYNFELKEVDAFSTEGQDMVKRFGITSVPTTIIEEGGKEEVAFIGVPSKDEAIERIKGE